MDTDGTAFIAFVVVGGLSLMMGATEGTALGFALVAAALAWLAAYSKK